MPGSRNRSGRLDEVVVLGDDAVGIAIAQPVRQGADHGRRVRRERLHVGVTSGRGDGWIEHRASIVTVYLR